ncbi:MAG: methanol--corrinoid methyltransferase [Thermoprotei archaeon]|nr:MAG: methanol--corrinoid methyltransferase [Thermoprotei archaeon]
MTRFTSLSYEDPRELVFGRAKQPMRYGLDLEVGAGRVVPELKYWPSRGAEEAGKLVEEFGKITRDVLERAVDLGMEALQLETELNYKATMQPKLAREIVETQRSIMEDYHSEHGIALALRVTVADIRWSRQISRDVALALMMEAFEEVAAAGADVLSIESIGGKEVFDYSIVRGDLEGIALSLGILAPIDVERLWREVVRIAARHGAVAGGDTACGFANTAMKLAGGFVHRMMPHTLAAVVRAMSISRTLKAYEVGARGPGKDCAYENVAIKAITGYPISMEGKTSAVAHSSLVGNVAAATCDLWSNEQVENLKLFGGTGPQVFLEILHYDCELMNAALRMRRETILRNLMVESDAWKDPQALILAPLFAWEIASAVVKESDDYRRALRAGIKALQLIEVEWRKGRLRMDDREAGYMLRLKREFEHLPLDAEDLLEKADYYESRVSSFNLSDYL